MTIVAKTRPGSEYMYSGKSAHRVSKASAEYIRDILNQYKYLLNPGETWHIYEIDGYDAASDYVQEQYCRVYKGRVKAYSPYA